MLDRRPTGLPRGWQADHPPSPSVPAAAEPGRRKSLDVLARYLTH